MKTPKLSSRERVLKAARACFAKHGIAKTTMDDVAEAAQLARMTVYRAFPSRNALLHAVALQSLEQFIHELIQEFKPNPTFEVAFMAVALKSVEQARNDPFLLPIVQSMDEKDGLGFFVAENSPIDELWKKLWTKALEKARATQQLKADIEDQELMAWFRDIVYILLMRRDLDRSGQEALLRKFVLPALRGAGCAA